MKAPNEVLITSVSAINTVHGPRSTTTKHHTFYDYMQYHGAHNLDSLHDRREHRDRRRIWDLALSNKNMETYELNARETIHVWLHKIAAAAVAQDSLDVSLCMSLVSFDNMTRTGFSLDPGALDPPAKAHMIHLMEANLARVSASALSMWPLLLMSKVRLLQGEGQFDALTHEMVHKREVYFPDNLDLWHYI